MKFLQFALLAVALVAPAALLAQGGWQGGGPGGPMAGRRRLPSVDEEVTRLAKDLNLTDTQKPQVKAILQGQRDQMKKLMEDSSGSREDRFSKMREIHQQSSAKIRDLLTDEQKTKYDKLQAERRQRMQEHRRGGSDDGGPDQGPPPDAPPGI